ncbi:hypothetical protein TNCV_3181021 [Trichonephila clavipes]|nr:hypothetical protein TNCV_3181021 [Trichonephila clavipes]
MLGVDPDRRERMRVNYILSSLQSTFVSQGHKKRPANRNLSKTNFTELNRTVTYVMLKAKANDMRTSSPLPR